MLCEPCRARLDTTPRITSRKSLVGLSVCDYETDSAKLIHEFKENGQTAIAKVLAEEMAKGMLRVFSKAQWQQIVLVPVPSSKSAFAKRGFEPANILAQMLGRQLSKELSIYIPVQRLLKFSRRVEDQSLLGLWQRTENLTGSMVAVVGKLSKTDKVDKTNNGNKKIFLIDDVVTTGATVLEASRALSAAGYGSVRFVSFAETLLKSSPRRPFGV